MTEKNLMTKVEEITPEIAQKLLDKSREFVNRPISRPVVERYAAIMADGAWELNGETIVIGSDGMVTDGYHRLNAICKAGKTIRSVVVRGTDPASYATMDQGRSRSLANVLYREGVQNYSAVAAIARVFRALELGRASNLNTAKFDARELLELVERLPIIHKWGEAMKRISKICPVPSAVAASAMWIDVNTEHGDDVNVFFDGLIDGTDLRRGSPIWVLRERLVAIRANGSHQRGAKPESVIYFVLRAWAAYRTGEIITRLATPKEGISKDVISGVDPRNVERHVAAKRIPQRWRNSG